MTEVSPYVQASTMMQSNGAAKRVTVSELCFLAVGSQAKPGRRARAT